MEIINVIMLPSIIEAVVVEQKRIGELFQRAYESVYLLLPKYVRW